VIATGIDAVARDITVVIGSPAVVGALDTNVDHHLNLFFYRFEPSGFEAGAQPDLPWRIRMFCMITPFAVVETSGGSTISAGENDMRILGDVLRVLHEEPILAPVMAGGIEVRSRVVFMSITDEQINQVWSTQGDTHYRPSAVFEVSLSPIVPQELMPEPAIVGAIGAEVRASNDSFSPFAGVVSGPPVQPQSVDTRDPAWVPATALMLDDALHQSLSFDINGAAFAGFVPAVWIAGDPTASVSLVWQVWRSTGWETVGAPRAATPASLDIDPRTIPTGLPGFPVTAALPEALAIDATSLQLMLFAERQVTRFVGGPVETVRSAPLLITLWQVLP
jgi:hypothetical protein